MNWIEKLVIYAALATLVVVYGWLWQSASSGSESTPHGAISDERSP